MNGQAFELTVGSVLTAALGVSEDVGAIVAARIGVAGALNVIDRLVYVDSFALPRDATKAWVKLAREATKARNFDIHTPWAARAEGGELAEVVDRARKLVPKSPRELSKTVTLLRQATEAGQQLLPERGEEREAEVTV